MAQGSRNLRSVCVFCGSSDAVRADYLDAARAVGRSLAARRLALVFGGGRTGLMGALADAALEAGGQAIGVIPRHFNDPARAHGGLSELHVVETMHARKAMMAELADAFLALPGGYGTLEELFEALTWAQIGLHDNPVGLLNVEGYYDPLLALIERLGAQGFVAKEHHALLISEADPERLLDRLEAR